MTEDSLKRLTFVFLSHCLFVTVPPLSHPFLQHKELNTEVLLLFSWPSLFFSIFVCHLYMYTTCEYCIVLLVVNLNLLLCSSVV